MSSNLWKSAKSLNQKLFPQFENIKHGRLSKVFDLIRDYKQALIDTFVYIKTKPIKATFYGTMIGLTLFTSKNNPDMESYREFLLDCSNRHSLISDLIRNKQSQNFIKNVMKYNNENRLVYWNFGIFSLVLLNNYAYEYDNYEKHCSTIRPRWISIDSWKERLIDIGFMNYWFVLNNVMVDFDVNEEEFIS